MLTEKLKLLLGIGTNHHRSSERVFLSYLAFFVTVEATSLFFTFERLQTQSHLWALIGSGVIYIAYLSGMNYRHGAQGLLFLNFGHVIFNVLLTGGIHSPFVACLTLMPTLALMMGRRSAYWWLGGVLVSICALALINYEVPAIQNYRMPSEHASWSMVIQICMTFGLYATIWILSVINEQRLDELKTKSQELAHTHQALKSAQAHKDEFIAAVGHELRTPMNAILGFTDILSHEAKSPKAIQTIRHIRTSAKQLLKVVSNILDYSQLMAGKLQLSLKQDRPFDLIQETIASIQYQHQEQPIDIVFKAMPGAPATSLLDTFRIRQVLEHLLSNSIKFMGQGRIEVVLSGNDQVMRVQVSDFGIGISEEKQKSIFKRFEHANREVNRRYGGAGLGLAICDRLVELHGGHIGVESTLGFGSTFWFEIPTNPLLHERHPANTHDAQLKPGRDELPFASLSLNPIQNAYQWILNALIQNNPLDERYPRAARAQTQLQQIVVTCLPAPLYYWFSDDPQVSNILASYPLFFILGLGLLIAQVNYRWVIQYILGYALLLTCALNLYLGGSHGVMHWSAILTLPAFSLLGEIAGLTWMGLIIGAQVLMMLATTWHQLPLEPEMTTLPIGIFWLGYFHMTLVSLLLPLHYKILASKVRDAILLQHVRLEQTQSELIQEQKIKDEFISSVSHEFRTPMNAIMGFNYLLKEQIKDEPSALGLQSHVTQSADHLLTVIDDIFDFSEIQHGQLNIRKEPFDVQQVFQNAYGMFLSKTRQLEYKLQIAHLPRWVIGDSHRLMQLLVNLIGNALKFTHTGFVHIGARAHNGGIEFQVRDTGVGIEGDQLELIFSQYGQIPHDRAKLGHGLGLAICKRLIEQQNGTIEVQSLPNTGSCFSVWLPYPICPKPLQTMPTRQRPTASLTALKILIVDDHPLNRILARQIFERTWHDAIIDEAEDGAKAIQKIRLNEFDIVVMDMVMPEMDGIEATTRIRTSMTEDKCQIPILGLTANINPADKERCLQAGMNEIIYKPFNKDELISSIERLLTPTAPQAMMA